MKTSPELWAHALPEEVCIVRRDVLASRLGLDMAEYMMMDGVNVVEAYAHHARYKAEQKRYEARYHQSRAALTDETVIAKAEPEDIEREA